MKEFYGVHCWKTFIMNRWLKWLVTLFVQRLFNMRVNWTWEALFSIYGQELGIEASCIFMGNIFIER